MDHPTLLYRSQLGPESCCLLYLSFYPIESPLNGWHFPTHHVASIMLNPIVLLLKNPQVGQVNSTFSQRISRFWVNSWFSLGDIQVFGWTSPASAVDLRSRRGQLREGHPAAAAGVATHRSGGSQGDVHGSWAEMGWCHGMIGHQDG